MVIELFVAIRSNRLMGINNVEKALMRINVQLRDSDTSFRDFGDVLQDIAGKWNTLNEIEQSNIAKAVAGVRQREAFLVLMQNFNKVTEDGISVQNLLEDQYESAGLATERYAIYLDNIEAAQNRATASWESLWEATIKSDWVKQFYNASAAIFETIESMGGLHKAIATLIPVIAALKAKEMQSLFASAGANIMRLIPLIKGLTTVQGTFNVVASMNPYIWIPLAIASVLLLVNSIESATEKANRLRKELEDSQNELDGLRSKSQKVSELSEAYDDLKKKTVLSAEESQKFTAIQNELKSILPEISGKYDIYGNFIISSSENMAELNEKTREQISLQEKLKQVLIDESARSEALALSEASEKYSRLKKDPSLSESEKMQAEMEYLESLELARRQFAQMSEDAQEEFLKGLRNKFGAHLISMFKEFSENNAIAMTTESWARNYSEMARKIEEATEQVEEQTEAYKGLSETIKELKSEFESLDALSEKSIKGELTFEDLEKLPQEYIDALYVENGQYHINIELLKQKKMEMLEVKLAAVEAAYALGEASQYEVDAIKSQIDILRNEMAFVHGEFSLTAWENEKVLWGIANAAQFAGYQFVDMEGKALNSASAIYDFLASGSVEFANFAQQLAAQTGQTVAQIMSQISSLVGTGLGSGAVPTYDFSSVFATPPPKYGGGGGGGGGGKSAEQIRIEKEIKVINDKKKALQDALKEFKRYIDAEKQMLKLKKEELEYERELEKKTKALAKMRTEIALLALDDSEEAKARRIKLEEEASALEEEIIKAKEDRTYDLQIQALDKIMKDYEDAINAQLALLDDKIVKLKEEESQLKSVGGGVGGVTQQYQNQGLVAVPIIDTIISRLEAQFGKLNDLERPMRGRIQQWLDMGMATEEAYRRAVLYYDYLQRNAWLDALKESKDGEKRYDGRYHSGGFVGGIRSNEEFAKLLKGEYVATESDMKRFMENILPEIARYQRQDISSGGVTLSMPINVQGNLDKSVIPDLEKIAEKVVKTLNNNVMKRGVNRRVDDFI